MDIKTSENLKSIRQSHGLSVLELSEKIGVSEAEILYWESGEKSPNTDDLIKLSKLYNCSVDDLLGIEKDDKKTDSDRDHVSFKNGIHVHSHDGDKVDIGLGGVHVLDKKGSSVDVGWNGINVQENGENKVYTDENGEVHYSQDVENFKDKRKKYHKFPIVPIVTILYLIFGFMDICGGWAVGWVVFLLIPLYFTLVEAIIKKRPDQFAYPVLISGIYILMGMLGDYWHPGWVIFLTIPIYYWIADMFKKK